MRIGMPARRCKAPQCTLLRRSARARGLSRPDVGSPRARGAAGEQAAVGRIVAKIAGDAAEDRIGQALLLGGVRSTRSSSGLEM